MRRTSRAKVKSTRHPFGLRLRLPLTWGHRAATGPLPIAEACPHGTPTPLPEPEIEYRFPVAVPHWMRLESWARAEAGRIAGDTGCLIDAAGWRGTTVWFDTIEKS